MALANPGVPVAGTDVEAAPILANLEGLDVRTSAVETVIDNITVDARTYGNGVFKDGLAATEVGTELQYSVGGLVVNHVYYPKTSLTVDFNGKAADTYYVEAPAGGVVAIYTAHDVARANLNTVVWDGSTFTSVTTADRNELSTYQEIIDARGTHSDLDARLDAIEDGTTPLAKAVLNQSSATLTIGATHNTIICDTTSNGITVTLPAVAGYIGKDYTFYLKTHSSGNTLVINTNAADTYDGTNTTATLTLGDMFIIRGIGGNRWMILDSTGVVLS